MVPSASGGAFRASAQPLASAFADMPLNGDKRLARWWGEQFQGAREGAFFLPSEL